MSVIGTLRSEAQAKILNGALTPIRELITDAVVTEACRTAQHSWNRCIWNPTLTILACVWKQLKDTGSSRQTEDWVASLGPAEMAGRNDGADFCAARRRLPACVFREVMQRVGKRVSQESGRYWQGLRVWLVDGTTLRTPNTSENEKTFGRSKNQTRRSRSPLLRLVVLICAGCGAVLNCSVGCYSTSEWELFLRMLAQIPPGGLLIADRAYGSFLVLSLMPQHGTHVVTRQHSRRRGRIVKQHGKGDEWHEWKKPSAAQVSRPDLLQTCPATILVRVITQRIERCGYRAWTLRIVTTLLDPELYPADELVDLYLDRWDVETDLRVLKTDYGMARLTGKTPTTVYKEIYSIMLAYNCVLGVMADSGQAVRWLSHTRSRELILEMAARMTEAPTLRLPELYRLLLVLIAQAQLDLRERPPQPRAIVQRPSTYPVLMVSRKAWRSKIHAA